MVHVIFSDDRELSAVLTGFAVHCVAGKCIDEFSSTSSTALYTFYLIFCDVMVFLGSDTKWHAS